VSDQVRRLGETPKKPARAEATAVGARRPVRTA